MARKKRNIRRKRNVRGMKMAREQAIGIIILAIIVVALVVLIAIIPPLITPQTGALIPEKAGANATPMTKLRIVYTRSS